MNKNIQKGIFYLSIVVILLLTAEFSYGQDTMAVVIDTTSRDLESENIEVIKAFEVKLADASILKFSPKLPDVIPIDKKYDYKVTIVPYAISYPGPVIRPMAMVPDEREEYFNYYLKAGYGNVKNAFADLHAHHSFSDLYDWDLHLKYHSADNSNEVPNQKYNSFSASTDLGFSIFETSRIEIGINGGLDKRHFYYDAEDLIIKPWESGNEAIRDLSRIGGKLRFYNSTDNHSEVDYLFALETNYSNLSDIDENEFNGITTVSLKKRSSTNLSFTFAGGGDLNSSFNNTDVIGIFEPKLAISGSKSSIEIGLDYLYANESSSVFPKSLIKYAVNEKSVQVFAGTEMSYYRNNIFNISQFNPYSIGFDSISTAITKDIFGGVKGDILGLIYSVKAGYKDLKHQAFFNTDFQDSLRRLEIGTTNLNASYITATLEMPAKDFLTVGGSFTYNIFNNIETEELWHIPSMEFNAFAKLVFLDDKLCINSDLFLRNSPKILVYNEIQNLENLIDLNIELEYLPVKNAGIYVKGKNLLDKSFRKWYSYPNLGIHVEGGVVLKF